MSLGLQTLRLRGFRRYEDETFTFAPGVNFLEGENNAGKTTVLYAIEYALFGRVGSLQPAGLLRTGSKAVGVEVVFDGRDGRRYRLQRLHVRPPRSRTSLHGYFTLKVADPGDPEVERYLLSSDFDDREDQLADALVRALGVSRRAWELAVHLKQGTIADLLDGSPQLDIVLGVTSAVFVEDELRSMALERGKAADELPVVVEALARLDAERQARGARLEGMEAEQAAANARSAELEARTAEVDARDRAVGPLRAASEAVDRASAALGTATEERDRAARARSTVGVRADLEQHRDEHQARVAASTKQRDHDRRALVDLRSAARDLDRQRADVAGRLERRRAQQGSAICDHCGQAVDATHLARELPALEAALAAIDEQISVAEAAVATAEQAAEAHQEELTGATVAAREAEQALERLGEAEAEEEAASRALAEAEGAMAQALTAGRAFVADPAELRVTLDRTLDALKTDRIRLDVDRQHVDERRERLAADVEDGAAELQRLDRERSEASDRHRRLVRHAEEATRLRALAKAFKAVQQDVREQATTAMAERTLALHRHLSGADEIEALTIDPARYTVMVTPRDMGVSVPASTHQGGGHRLLLGLALRLALAEQIGPVPFVLLDEPTYGLDAARREALLSRISSLGVTEQLLVITHHEVSTEAHRLRVVRDGVVSRIAP